MLSSALWPFGSGGELATYLYAKLLKEKNVNVVVFTCNKHASRNYNFKVTNLPCLDIGRYSLYSRKILREYTRSADVVYITPSLWSLILIVKRFGKPVVVHLHSYDPICPVGSLYNFMYRSTCSPFSRDYSGCIWLYEREHGRGYTYSIGSTILNSLIGRRFARLLRYADALIFVSNAHRDLSLKHLKRILGTNIPRSFVIYNPVPRIDYVTPKELNVGYFGGLSPLKGFQVLVEAWVRIYRRFPNVKLIATKMSRLAGSEALRRLNIFALGRLGLAELEDVWSRVGVVVFPSIWQEPAPYVVVESLLRGRVLVASRVGGVPEIVGNAPGVKLVEPENVDALRDALEWALSMDGEDIVELGVRNREYALKKFDSEDSVNRLIRVFEEVATQH